MPDPSILIQKPVARCDSIRMQLANEIWHWGHGAFFLEQIPFSIRNGQLYAQKLVALFALITKNSTINSPYHIYEMGAGLGFLSKCFLDQLQIQYPDTYKKTTLHITDASKDMVQHLMKSRLFQNHRAHVRFDVQLAATPKFKKHQAPCFIFSNNLIDSLNSHHIIATPNAVKELLIQTEINTSAEILNPAQFPPQIINAEAIAKLLKSNSNPDKKFMAHNLLSQLKETKIESRDAIQTWPKPAQELLFKFLKHHPIATTACFNFSYDAHTHLKIISQNLCPGGAYILSDFGLADQIGNPEPTFLLTEYKLAAFYSVCFPLIKYMAKALNMNPISTNHELDQVQELLLLNGPISDEISNFFAATFTHIGYEKISPLIDKLHESVGNPNQEWPAWLKPLSSEEKSDYYLLKSLSMYLMQNNHYEALTETLNTMKTIYVDFAYDAILISGWLEQKKGNHTSALNYFNQALAIGPNSWLAHMAAGVSELQNQQFERAIHNFKKSMLYSQDNLPWLCVFSIGVCFEKMNQFKQAESIYRWPILLAKTHPNQVPESIISKCQAKLEAIKTQ